MSNYDKEIDQILDELGEAYHNDYPNQKAHKKAKQALTELVDEAYENGRKVGIAENQFETINKLRKSQGKPPITLAELSSNKLRREVVMSDFEWFVLLLIGLPIAVVVVANFIMKGLNKL